MSDITYHQLLAQQYEENAKTNPIHREDLYEDEGYTVEEYTTSPSRNQLEDNQKFQVFAGNRNEEDIVLKGANFEDKSKLSVRYNKDVKTTVFSVDTRFRAASTPFVPSFGGVQQYDTAVISSAIQLTNRFLFRFSRQVKNAISIKLTSLEFPNTFANFIQYRGNTSFGLRITGSGNPYTKIDIANSAPQYLPTPKLLAAAVQTALQNSTGVAGYATFSCTVVDGYIQISNSSPAPTGYDFDFTTNVTTPSLFRRLEDGELNFPTLPQLFDTLGTSLGFSTNYSGVSTVTGIYLPDTNVDDYIYIAINEYNTVTPQTLDNTYFSVFAKIPMRVEKGVMLFDTETTNTNRKIFQFLQPTNIQTLDIQLLDRTGTLLANTQDYSMTLEIEEVVSQALYEKLREL
jgi:hypothetical protein